MTHSNSTFIKSPPRATSLGGRHPDTTEYVPPKSTHQGRHRARKAQQAAARNLKKEYQHG